MLYPTPVLYQEKFAQNENIADNRHDTVGTDRAMARRPRKHEYTEERHQSIGPEKPRHAEDKVQLDNDVED